MNKSFERSNIRRDFALAFFFSVFLLIGTNGIFAQTSVSQTGIIMERVADDDVKEAERLNVEAHAEDEAERQKLVEQDLLSEAEDDSSIDELFGEDSEGDTDTAVSTPTTEIVKVDVKDKPVEFGGNLSAELGAYAYIYPWKKTTPLATFNNILKFTGRPRTDFYVYGSFLTAFPEMDFGIYELYFDYTLFGLADISAGKRDISWGHSRLLDTNIIDDECSVITAENAIRKKDRTTKDSKFSFYSVIPFLSYGSFQGLAQYESNVTHDDMAEYVSLAGRVEGNFGKFSIAALGKRWASADANKYEPCIGFEVLSTIFGNNSNIFVQGLAHINQGNKKIGRARLSAGVYKYFETPIRIGFSLEYQLIWGDEQKSNDSGNVGQYEGFQHLFAAEFVWRHTIANRTWNFGCKWFHDTRGENNAGAYGTVTPGIQISEILPHLDFKMAVPIYYGSQESYSIVFEVILNLKY